MAKNNVNALNEEQLGSISGGVMGRTQLTPEQKTAIENELKKNDGGLGYAKMCKEFGINPDKKYLSPFVKDQLGL